MQEGAILLLHSHHQLHHFTSSSLQLFACAGTSFSFLLYKYRSIKFITFFFVSIVHPVLTRRPITLVRKPSTCVSSSLPSLLLSDPRHSFFLLIQLVNYSVRLRVVSLVCPSSSFPCSPPPFCLHYLNIQTNLLTVYSQCRWLKERWWRDWNQS